MILQVQSPDLEMPWEGTLLDLQEGNNDLSPFLVRRLRSLGIGQKIRLLGGSFVITRIQ